MKCILCGKNLEINISFSNIFKVINKDICDSCYKKYSPKLNYIKKQYKSLIIHHLYLFDEKHDINFHVFINEMTYLTKLALLKDFQIFYFKEFEDIYTDIEDLVKIFKEITVISIYK